MQTRASSAKCMHNSSAKSTLQTSKKVTVKREKWMCATTVWTVCFYSIILLAFLIHLSERECNVRSHNTSTDSSLELGSTVHWIWSENRARSKRYFCCIAILCFFVREAWGKAWSKRSENSSWIPNPFFFPIPLTYTILVGSERDWKRTGLWWRVHERMC